MFNVPPRPLHPWRPHQVLIGFYCVPMALCKSLLRPVAFLWTWQERGGNVDWCDGGISWLWYISQIRKIKWNESGFRPLLCTCRLNWARRTSWGWWDEWDDTALQTQHSKFEPWRSEVEHATSRSRRLSAILSFTSGWGRNIFVSFKPPSPENELRTLAWKASVLTTTLA